MTTLWGVITSPTLWIAIGSLSVIALLLQFRFNSWLKAQEVFTEEKFTKARKTVLEKFGEPDQWDSITETTKYKVCRKMDEVSRLFPYVGTRRALKVWDDPIGKSWKILEKFVYEERKKVSWKRKWEAFERVGKKALRRLKIENSPRTVSDNDRFTFFLRQDKLLWSRLQTLGVIQVATLGAAYSVRTEKWLDIGVLVFGGILTLLIFLLLKRDEIIRDEIGKTFRIGYDVGRKWYTPLKGAEIIWLIVICLFLADFLMGWVVYYNLID